MACPCPLAPYYYLSLLGLAPSVASACGVMDAWCELNCVAEASSFFDGLLAQRLLRPSAPQPPVYILEYPPCRCRGGALS